MIAGQKISFLPGTRVYNTGYLHAYIFNGTWCNSTDGPVAAAPVSEKAVAGLEKTHFGIYPNPTNGNVTLVQKGETLYSNIRVEVYTLQGERIMTETIKGEQRHDLAFSGLKTGLYFVKIVAEGYVETIKLVKL
jgi:hypothetical protein